MDESRGTGDVAKTRDGNVPLPFASLSEAGMEEYEGERDNAGVIRAAYVTPDLKYGYNVDWPTPVKLPYQLDLWCKTQHQAWYFRDLIRRLFKLQVTYVEVDFTSPLWTMLLEEVPDEVRFLGKRQVAMKSSSWTDASNLEPGDGFKDVRITLSLEVTAWMARGYTKVPLARRIVTQLRELDNGSLLTTFAVEGAIGNNNE